MSEQQRNGVNKNNYADVIKKYVDMEIMQECLRVISLQDPNTWAASTGYLSGPTVGMGVGLKLRASSLPDKISFESAFRDNPMRAVPAAYLVHNPPEVYVAAKKAADELGQHFQQYVVPCVIHEWHSGDGVFGALHNMETLLMDITPLETDVGARIEATQPIRDIMHGIVMQERVPSTQQYVTLAEQCRTRIKDATPKVTTV